MLDLWLPGDYRNGRLTATYVIDPIVVPKDTQALSYRFVQGLDGVLDSPQIATGHCAGADAHGRATYHIRCLFAMTGEGTSRLRAVLKEEL
jgi:hypothetical protein